MLKRVLLYVWMLPQNVLGLIFRGVYKGNDSIYKDAVVRRSTRMGGGISLGKYIVLNQWSTKASVMHEYGHCVQSKYLGWFYLLVVGLPSLIHAWLCKCKRHSYNDYWCEKWADRLGEVK